MDSDAPSTNTSRQSPGVHRPVRYFGDYELIEELARGGMGVVYRARQVSLNRPVALKMILEGQLATPALKQRFHTEAEASARLNHPNIVPIHEIGEHDGRHFYSMKLIEGGTLAEAMTNSESPDSEETRRLRSKRGLEQTTGSSEFEPGRSYDIRHWAFVISKVARAVHHAHQRGVLHRDLKPTNILIDGKGEPHVTDFGLAKLAEDDSSLTLTTAVLGTPAYMSPEQAAGRTKGLTTAADTYSLGAILYELLTGQPPFRAETAIETMRKVVEEEPIPPSLIWKRFPAPASFFPMQMGNRRSQLDRDLETICLKCLNKDPQRRYGSAELLADDLDRWRNGEPITARPVNTAERFLSWCRRKPALAASLFLISVLCLVVIIGSPIAVFHIHREKQRAEELAKQQVQLRRQMEHRAYASDMKQAQQALERNQLGRTLDLLNRQRPAKKSSFSNPQPETPPTPVSPPSTDLRGWEWRYLWNQCRSDPESVFCKGRRSTALSVSHDGKWLAVATGNTGVGVWDLATRRRITKLVASGQMVRAAFSPRELLLAYSDFPAFGSSSTNFSVHLWDGTTQRIVASLKLSNACYGLAFSPDGRILVTLTQDKSWSDHTGQMTLWRMPDGKEIASLSAPLKGQGEGTPFAIAGDFSVGAHVFEDKQVRVIDLATGEQRWKSEKATEDFILALAFSPDGKILASGEGPVDPLIRLWDVATGRELGRLTGHGSGICQLLFFPDGTTLASASNDQTVRIWDVTDPAGGREINLLRGHRDFVSALALLPDKITLVSGSGDATVRLWDTRKKPKDHKRLTLPTPVGLWRFAPDSKSMVVLEDHDPEAVMARWQGVDFQDRQPLFNLGTNADQICFSTDARWMAASRPGGMFEVWDLQRSVQVGEFATRAKNVSPVEFMAGGRKLMLVYQDDNSLHEWDLESGRETRSWPGRPGRYTGAFSPDGNSYLTSILNPDARIVTTLTDLNSRLETNLNPNWYAAACFSFDGKLLALAGWSRDVRLLESATGREIDRIHEFTRPVWSAAFSPDDKRLATGSYGQEAVKLWDAESREQVLNLEGQGSLFNTIGFSPDGNILAAMNWNRVLHLWRAPSWAEIEAVEKAEQAPIRQLANGRTTFPGEEGRIGRWLVLAPIALQPEQNGREGLDAEQLIGEARLRPVAGEIASTREGRLPWREVALSADADFIIDFNELLGRETTRSVAYAVCYIHSDTERTGLQMLVGSDDQAKVYLNGKQVHRFAESREFMADEDLVPDLILNAGLNVLVFKVVNESAGWQGAVRLADANGNPVKGIQVTLKP